MKKRMIALLLAGALLLGCAGAAAESELGRVTLLVKELLGIGDEYTDFYGDSYSDAAGTEYWSLNWLGEGGSVFVTCDPDGEVYEYSRNDSEEEWERWSSDFAPRLCEDGSDRFQPVAEAFLEKVLRGECGWRVTDSDMNKRNFNPWSYTFSGPVTRHGYDTQAYWNLTVRASDGVVVNFWRSDAYTAYTSFAVPEELLDEGAAAALLEGNLSMELRYIRDESGKAVLVYLPRIAGSGYVDAATGAGVEPNGGDMIAYEESAGMAADGKGMETFPRASLTEVEISGIEATEGLLSREELDKRARAIAEFGLTDEYVLSRVNTVRDGDAGVFATLRYLCEVDGKTLVGRFGFTEEEVQDAEARKESFCIEKIVCLQAEDGAIVSLNTYYPIGSAYAPDAERGEAEARAVAEGFLERYFPERSGHTSLRESTDDAFYYWYEPQWNFLYERAENGIPYEEDYFAVSVNIVTGLVDDFHCSWDEEMEFESAEDVIGAERAKEIWLMQLETKLRYVDVLDSREEYAETYKGVLCYTLEAAPGLVGVTARDGSLYARKDETAGYAYEDLEDCPEREAIETLGAHGIGFPGGEFRPNEAVSLRDWLALLLQAGDYTWVDPSKDADLTAAARDAGIPLPGGDLAAPVTRVQAARMLVAMGGYGKAAGLREAFVCGFADDDQLSDADYGYVAIARAMGVARGDASGAFRPNDAATRAEAAAMLLAFLTRAV